MEYIVIRKIGLTDKKAFLNRLHNLRIGEREDYTQSFIGKYKFRQSVGDILWISVKEEGVFKKVKIKEKIVEKIYNKEQLQALKNTVVESLKNDIKYWDSEEKKISELNNRELSFLLLKTEVIEVLSSPFPLRLNKYPQNGWQELNNDVNKSNFFKLQNRKIPESYIDDQHQSTLEISSEVKQHVIDLFGENTTFYGKKVKGDKVDAQLDNLNNTSLDNDHFVPRKIGGPGNIIQNVLPIHSRWNRSKNAKIPKSLIRIAKKYFEFPAKSLDGFNWSNEWKNWIDVENSWLRLSLDDSLIKLEIEYIAIYITCEALKLSLDIRRKLYFEVVENGLLNDLIDVYPESKKINMTKFDISDVYKSGKLRCINELLKDSIYCVV